MVLNPTGPIWQIQEGEEVEMRKRGKNREQSLPCEILSFSFLISPSKSKTFWELTDESLPNVITQQLREEKMAVQIPRGSRNVATRVESQHQLAPPGKAFTRTTISWICPFHQLPLTIGPQ